ncbi:MAG: YARHG domain-containing protein, partial [Ruminococcus sp.]|nr:YARHG domain-containing protein [Candidatus Copronaster equi]
MNDSDVFCQSCGAMNNSDNESKKNNSVTVAAIIAVTVVVIAIIIAVAVVLINKQKNETINVEVPVSYEASTSFSEIETTVTTITTTVTTEQPKIINNYNYYYDPYGNPYGTEHSDFEFSYYKDYDYLFPSDKYLLTTDFLDTKTSDEIYLIRNEIYARHGYIFKMQKFRDYFEQKAWYHGTEPSMEKVAAQFNSIENKNIAILVKYQGS